LHDEPMILIEQQVCSHPKKLIVNFSAKNMISSANHQPYIAIVRVERPNN